MAEQANLGDSRVLEGLLHSLRGLPRMIDRALANAEAEATPRMARFELALHAAREEVRAAERALEVADDEEGRWHEDTLEDARDRLRRIEAAADDLADALGDYRGAARNL